MLFSALAFLFDFGVASWSRVVVAVAAAAAAAAADGFPLLVPAVLLLSCHTCCAWPVVPATGGRYGC